MKHIAILGSTGSIGKSTLAVIRKYPDRFDAVALSTNTNIEDIYSQIKEFHPKVVCVVDLVAARKLKLKLGQSKTRVLSGPAGLEDILRNFAIDEVVLAISGSAALAPFIEAINNRKEIAVANKEALVMAGSIIMKKAADRHVRIIPIDSEQSAIHQCLCGQDAGKLKDIYLTASGGPFRNLTVAALSNITVTQALRHPRWKMGKKITIDSATLMNKGLEVIEAMHLFGVGVDKIKVIVHPESIIHSMVEFVDGVVMAQLSVTDMCIPIQYSLSYPQRLPSGFKSLDFSKLKSLNFYKPDLKRFPCLRLAFTAAKELGTMPAVLNAANEVSVGYFLNKRIKFSSIPQVIEKVMDMHKKKPSSDIAQIMEADQWARNTAALVIERMN